MYGAKVVYSGNLLCNSRSPQKTVCLTRWSLRIFFLFTCDVGLCLSPMCNTHTLTPHHDLPVHSVTVESLWPPLYSHGHCWQMTLLPPSFYPCLYSRSHLGCKKRLLYPCLVPLSDHKMVLSAEKKSAICVFLNSLRVIYTWLCAGVHWKWQIYKPTCIVHLLFSDEDPTRYAATYKLGISVLKGMSPLLAH